MTGTFETWLAAYRITRLGVKDSITRVPRNKAIARLFPEAEKKARAAWLETERSDADAGDFWHDANLNPHVPDIALGARGKVASILACVYCFGVYAGFAADWIPAWLRRGLAAAGFSALMYDLQKAISR